MKGVAGILDLQGKPPPIWEKQWPNYRQIRLQGGPRSRIKEKQVRKCIQFMKAFHAAHPTETLLVHCTHGLNRTGYIVCRYLMQEEKYTPEEAIAFFKILHPPGIERDHLKDHLQKK